MRVWEATPQSSQHHGGQRMPPEGPVSSQAGLPGALLGPGLKRGCLKGWGLPLLAGGAILGCRGSPMTRGGGVLSSGGGPDCKELWNLTKF